MAQMMMGWMDKRLFFVKRHSSEKNKPFFSFQLASLLVLEHFLNSLSCLKMCPTHTFILKFKLPLVNLNIIMTVDRFIQITTIVFIQKGVFLRAINFNWHFPPLYQLITPQYKLLKYMWLFYIILLVTIVIVYQRLINFNNNGTNWPFNFPISSPTHFFLLQNGPKWNQWFHFVDRFQTMHLSLLNGSILLDSHFPLCPINDKIFQNKIKRHFTSQGCDKSM